jgi:hypothetical protein
MWNIKHIGINSDSEEVSGSIYTIEGMYCVSENLNLFLYVFAAHRFCVLFCVPPLLGHGHSSVFHRSLFLQLFVNKRIRLREIMLESSFQTPFFLLNVKWRHSELYVRWRDMYRHFANDWDSKIVRLSNTKATSIRSLNGVDPFE